MRDLEEILEDYYTTRDSFLEFSRSGEDTKDALHEFELRFINIKADLREHHSRVAKSYEMRSDKGATAIKNRISISMIKGEYDFKGDTPMYEKTPTITNADKYAGATKEYKKFLDERAFYKESFVNLTDLREDIQNYIILIRSRRNG